MSKAESYTSRKEDGKARGSSKRDSKFRNQAKTVPRVIHGVMCKVDDEPCSVAAAQKLQVEFGGS